MTGHTDGGPSPAEPDAEHAGPEGEAEATPGAEPEATPAPEPDRQPCRSRPTSPS